MNFVDARDFSVALVLRSWASACRPTTVGARHARSRRGGPREDAELLRLIDEIRSEHEFATTYGSPRVWLELRCRGVQVSCKRVKRIMLQNGRQGAAMRRWSHPPVARPAYRGPLRCTVRRYPSALRLLGVVELGDGVIEPLQRRPVAAEVALLLRVTRHADRCLDLL
jgi:hypothetical protein